MSIVRETKADRYFLNCLLDIEQEGQFDVNPRPKWADGTPAHSKFITMVDFTYRIDKGEFPIQSYRQTALKGGFHDIETIYQKQTNIIEEMHPSIQPWWIDFVTKVTYSEPGGRREYTLEELENLKKHYPTRDFSQFIKSSSIGQTYGHTVKRYKLIDNLLKGMIDNPFGRRHVMNLWQEQQMKEDPKALVPCAYETIWSVTHLRDGVGVVDLKLNQRSMDYLVTTSINPMQYVQLGMMVCSHLSKYSGISYSLRKFSHSVQNLHIYDRHLPYISKVLENRGTGEFEMSLPVVKDFYQIRFEDFEIKRIDIKPLDYKLEIAV